MSSSVTANILAQILVVLFSPLLLLCCYCSIKRSYTQQWTWLCCFFFLVFLLLRILLLHVCVCVYLQNMWLKVFLTFFASEWQEMYLFLLIFMSISNRKISVPRDNAPHFIFCCFFSYSQASPSTKIFQVSQMKLRVMSFSC